MTFGAHIFRRFILFSKSYIGQFLTVLWPVHGLCVYGLFVDSFWVVLRLGHGRVYLLCLVFTASVWTICCADMLDCVLIYVDI